MLAPLHLCANSALRIPIPHSDGPSPSFKASKGGQRRTFGLFLATDFALRGLSTTCVTKITRPTLLDSNGTPKPPKLA